MANDKKPLDQQHVKQIAHLARIAISDDKLVAYTKDLNNILSLMDKLDKIDTDGIDPMASPHAFSQPLRKDEISATDQRDKLMSNAPDAKKGLFRVPLVIE